MLPFGRWWSRASRLENSLAAIISLNFTSFHFLLYGKEKFIFLDSRATSLLVVYCLGHPILESDEAFLFPPREGLMTFRWRRATLFRPISFRLISMGKHLRTSTMKSTNSNDRKCIPSPLFSVRTAIKVLFTVDVVFHFSPGCKMQIKARRERRQHRTRHSIDVKSK